MGSAWRARRILARAGSGSLVALVFCGAMAIAHPSAAQLGPGLAGRVAQAENAAVQNSNPAGLTRVEGTQFVLDSSLAYSFSEFEVKPGTSNSGGDPRGDDDVTVIPTFSVSHALGERFRLGLSVFFPGGIGTDYGDTWAGRYYTTESSLVFLSIQPSVAWRVNDWLSLGVGPSIMYVSSRSESAVNNLQPGLGDGKVELELDGFSAGANVAAMIEPWEGTRFAVSYRNEQEPDLEGRPDYENLGPLLRAALQQSGIFGSKIELGLRVPQAVQAGFYHRVDDRLSVMGDFSWVDWSRFGRVDVSVSEVSVTTSSDFNDIYVGSVGASYRLNDDWTLNVGGSYVSSAVDGEDRTLALPMDELYLFGVGGQYRFRPNITIHSNLSGVISGNARVDQESNPLAGRVRGEFEDTYSILFQIALVWGSQPSDTGL